MARERLGNGAPRGLLRERFDAVKDTAIDDAMGKGDSWAKKVGYGDSGVKLDDIPKLLAVLGLKLVDASRVCVTREQINEYEACRTLARAHLSPPQQLDQDWDKPT